MFAFLLVENIAVRPDQRGRGIGDKPLHPFRAGRARLNCVQLYTNAIRTSNLRPSWVPGIPTGDDCTEQRGRSQEVDQLIPSRALDDITDLPNVGFEQRWSFGNCGGARLFGRYR